MKLHLDAGLQALQAQLDLIERSHRRGHDKGFIHALKLVLEQAKTCTSLTELEEKIRSIVDAHALLESNEHQAVSSPPSDEA